MATLIACPEASQPAILTASTSLTTLSYVQDVVANLPSPPRTDPVTRHSNIPLVTTANPAGISAQNDPLHGNPVSVTSPHTPPPTPGTSSSPGFSILQPTLPSGLEVSLTPQDTSNTGSQPDAPLIADASALSTTGVATRKPQPRFLTSAILYQWMDIDAQIEEKWEVDLRSRIDELVKGAVRNSLEHMQETMFATKIRGWPHRQEDRRPSIVISVADTRDRKAVKKMLKKHRWLKEAISSCGLRLMVVEDPTKLQSKGKGAQNALSTSTYKAKFAVETYLPPSYCGTVLSATPSSGTAPANFTLGGTVIIDDAVYGLTSGHAFFDLERAGDGQASEATSSSRSISEESIDEWLENPRNPFVFREDDTLSAVSTSEDTPANCSLQNLQLDVQRSFRNAPDTHRTGDTSLYDVKVLAPSLAVQHGDSSRVKPRNCDWALVELPRDMPVPQNRYIEAGKEVPILGSVPRAKRPSGRVKIVLRVDQILEGHLRANAASYRVGACLFDVRLIYMDDPITAGCSGAWVLQDDVMCGYVVAARSDERSIYMLPIHSVLQDIRNTIGCRDVFIPVQDELAEQNQTKFRSGRLSDITTREQPDLVAQGGQFDGAGILYYDDGQPAADSEEIASHAQIPVEPRLEPLALPQAPKPVHQRPPLRPNPKKGSSFSVTSRELRTQDQMRSLQPVPLPNEHIQTSTVLTRPSAESKPVTQPVQRDVTAQVLSALEMAAIFACWPCLYSLRRQRRRTLQRPDVEHYYGEDTTSEKPELVTAPAPPTSPMLYEREMQQNESSLSASLAQTLMARAPLERPEPFAMSVPYNPEPSSVLDDSDDGDNISIVLPLSVEDRGYNSRVASKPQLQSRSETDLHSTFLGSLIPNTFPNWAYGSAIPSGVGYASTAISA